MSMCQSQYRDVRIVSQAFFFDTFLYCCLDKRKG